MSGSNASQIGALTATETLALGLYVISELDSGRTVTHDIALRFLQSSNPKSTFLMSSNTMLDDIVKQKYQQIVEVDVQDRTIIALVNANFDDRVKILLEGIKKVSRNTSLLHTTAANFISTAIMTILVVILAASVPSAGSVLKSVFDWLSQALTKN
jgi:hypothetical protein